MRKTVPPRTAEGNGQNELTPIFSGSVTFSRVPRTARNTPGGYVYHALSRAVAQLPLWPPRVGELTGFLR